MRRLGTSADLPRPRAAKTRRNLPITLCVMEILAVCENLLPLLAFGFCSSKNVLIGPVDAEALQVTFDPSIVTYSTLIEFFYRMHDPTTKDKQGLDRGTQYRSAIFYHTPEQEKVAKSVTEKVQKQWWKAKITTDIVEASRWYDAEAYHQLYLDKVRRPFSDF